MIALNDAVRGMNMFKKVNVPVRSYTLSRSNEQILGLIENMASFTCPHCHQTTSIFLEDGVQKEAKRNNVPVLGSVPLDRRICEDSDNGQPTVVQQGEDATVRAQAFKDIAIRLLKELGI